jgi:hypothetical protein
MGWTCQGNTTKIPWFREEHPFFSIFSYICALVNGPSQVPQLSKKPIDLCCFFSW